jgi:hypothetical protein
VIDLQVEWTEAPPRAGRPVFQALAAAEARRLLRSPLVLGGAALSGWALSLRAASPGEAYGALAGAALLPLAAATMVAAVLAASRDERAGSEELLDSAPSPSVARWEAHLLALAVPVAFAVALVLLGRLGAGDGLPVAYPTGIADRSPSIAELASGPVAVLALGALGVALARWRNGWIAAPFVLVMLAAWQVFGVFWQAESVTRWFGVMADGTDVLDWGSSFGGYPIVAGVDVTAVAWHLLFVLGLTAIAVWVALGRRPRWLLPAAASVTVVAGIVQVP